MQQLSREINLAVASKFFLFLEIASPFKSIFKAAFNSALIVELGVKWSFLSMSFVT